MLFPYVLYWQYQYTVCVQEHHADIFTGTAYSTEQKQNYQKIGLICGRMISQLIFQFMLNSKKCYNTFC